MHPQRCHLIPAAWTALALALTSTPVRAQCPLDTLCVVTGCSSWTGAQGSTSGSANNTSSSASYDLLSLKFNLYGNAGAGDLYSGGGSASANDLYVVAGPPDGTPVTLAVQVHVSGVFITGGPFPSAGGTARVGGPNGAVLSISGGAQPVGGFGYYGTVDSTAVMPLTVAAGEPFLLRWTVSGGAVSGSTSMGMTATFVNVPPGITIHSCQGYAYDSATAARTASWGRVKALYR